MPYESKYRHCYDTHGLSPIEPQHRQLLVPGIDSVLHPHFPIPILFCPLTELHNHGRRFVEPWGCRSTIRQREPSSRINLTGSVALSSVGVGSLGCASCQGM